MTRASAVAILVLLPVLAPAATAGDLRVVDANDVRGRLDIRAVAHGHGARKGLVTHRVVTHRPWRIPVLRRHGTVDLYFSRGPGKCVSMHVLIDSTKEGLRVRSRSVDPIGCGKYDDAGGSTPFEPIEAKLARPNRRTLKIRLARRLLPGRGDYGWTGETSFRKEDTRCRRRCYDEAPNRGQPRGHIAHRM